MPNTNIIEEFVVIHNIIQQILHYIDIIHSKSYQELMHYVYVVHNTIQTVYIKTLYI